MAKTKLTVPLLCQEASTFAEVESTYPEPTLYGVTDGKAIGTYLEHKFRAHLDVHVHLCALQFGGRHRFSRLGG